MKYFKEWEESVMSLIDVDDKEKKMLSKETRMGNEMTGMLSRIPQKLHANYYGNLSSFQLELLWNLCGTSSLFQVYDTFFQRGYAKIH